MSESTPTTRADRVRQRRDKFTQAGYSAGVAGALAGIDPDDVRTHIEARVRDLGVRDGVPRAYAIRLLACTLKAGDYPNAPSTLTPAESSFIGDRVGTIANELRKTIATERAEAKQRHEDQERERRHAEALERELTR